MTYATVYIKLIFISVLYNLYNISPHQQHPTSNITFLLTKNSFLKNNPISNINPFSISFAENHTIYATYWNTFGLIIKNNCTSDEISCSNSTQCISKKNWCDNNIDCVDASDETSCSCVSRINSTKLCDGFYDCPNGLDEYR